MRSARCSLRNSKEVSVTVRSTLAAAILVVVTATTAHAQEARRYAIGEIKVGDTISADPSALKHWLTCRVTKVRPLLANPRLIDGMEAVCETPNGPLVQGIIGDTDHARPISAAAQDANGAAQSANGAPRKAGPTAARKPAHPGAPFGARDPAVCETSSKMEPRSGAPSAAQAARYFACTVEDVAGGSLYLVENVKVQVFGPRPYHLNDAGGEHDTYKPVYPIRGSFRYYHCTPVSSMLGNAGANCAYAEESNAEGTCYHTPAGDWRCRMIDVTHMQDAARAVPPPR